MNKLLLNCDLGEWEDPQLTRQLMPHLNLANIACGGHAGSLQSIAYCAQLAHDHGVACGAHPGLNGDGRTAPAQLSSHDFRELVLRQIDLYRRSQTPLHHLKLHGALYHLSENSSEIAQTLAQICLDQQTILICLAQGNMAQAAQLAGVPTLAEAFLDRGYLSQIQLVPRGQLGDLIHDRQVISARIRNLRNRQQLTSQDGSILPIHAQTLCVHADSPQSLEILRLARQTMDELD